MDGCHARQGHHVNPAGHTSPPPTKSHLEGLGQLGAAGVPGVHGDERHDCGLEGNLHVLKQEALLAGTDGVQHCLVLGRAHRQHGHGDAVELVEAAPGACGGAERCTGKGKLRTHVQLTLNVNHRCVEHTDSKVTRIRLRARRAAPGAWDIQGGVEDRLEVQSMMACELQAGMQAAGMTATGVHITGRLATAQSSAGQRAHVSKEERLETRCPCPAALPPCPRTCLSQALVDLTHGFVIHLVRTVEHVALHANGTGEVLHRLCLTSTGRAAGAKAGAGWHKGWSKSKVEMPRIQMHGASSAGWRVALWGSNHSLPLFWRLLRNFALPRPLQPTLRARLPAPGSPVPLVPQSYPICTSPELACTEIPYRPTLTLQARLPAPGAAPG